MKWRPRRFHAYCVGSVKSGTHSIAGLFSRHYRAAHEPEAELLIETILDEAQSILNAQEKIHFIKTRDKRLWLELESSHLCYYFLDIFVKEFPSAKFILTIRDCYSWFDSYMNQKIFRDFGSYWQRLNEWRYQPDQLVYAKEEHILKEYGLYTLDSYFSLWAKHNQRVLALVPSERLLIIRTKDIPNEISRVAEFLDIPTETLARSETHLYRARDKFDMLSKIDRDFLEDRVHAHCKDLMERFFPDIWEAHH